MQSHHWIALFLITSLFIFAVWDVYLAFNKEKKTLSRYVIKKSKESKIFAFFAFIFAILIFLIGLWLPFHWEMPCILFNILCWLNI